MNLLTDRLPDKLDINGVGYPVYTDFRVWIKAAVMLEGSERGAYLLPKLLKLCLMPCNGKPFPEPGGFFAAFLNFYLCGEKPAEAKKKKGKRRPALFSYEYDAELIYAAFMAQYGIDLRAAYTALISFIGFLTEIQIIINTLMKHIFSFRNRFAVKI